MARGGARPGSGRPPKADEEKVRYLSVSAIVKVYGSEEKGFEHLLMSGEPALIKWVYEHAYGKPTEKIDLKTDSPILPRIVIKLDDGCDAKGGEGHTGI